MKLAVTISLVPEARGGPFVFWEDLAAACAEAREIGFHAIEIFPRDPKQLRSAEIERALDLNGLKVAAVGTGAGWVVHKLRLTDPDPAIRLKAVSFIKEIIEGAAAFGAPAIIGSMQGRFEAPIIKEHALGWLRDGLEELGLFAHNLGVSLLIEPLNRYETNILNEVESSVAFLRALGPRNVRLLCDLFHMNIEETDVANALRLAGPLVGHVHFADSNRRAIGFGHTAMAPIVAVLREITYNGYLSAEILPLPSPSEAAKQTFASYSQLVRAI